MSAADVLAHPAGDERDRAILTWARIVWSKWAVVHDRTAELCAAYALT